MGWYRRAQENILEQAVDSVVTESLGPGERWYLKALGSTCYDQKGITFPYKALVDWEQVLDGASDVRWENQFGWGNQPEVVTFTASRWLADRISKTLPSALLVVPIWTRQSGSGLQPRTAQEDTDAVLDEAVTEYMEGERDKERLISTGELMRYSREVYKTLFRGAPDETWWGNCTRDAADMMVRLGDPMKQGITASAKMLAEAARICYLMNDGSVAHDVLFTWEGNKADVLTWTIREYGITNPTEMKAADEAYEDILNEFPQTGGTPTHLVGREVILRMRQKLKLGSSGKGLVRQAKAFSDEVWTLLHGAPRSYYREMFAGQKEKAARLQAEATVRAEALGHRLFRKWAHNLHNRCRKCGLSVTLNHLVVRTDGPDFDGPAVSVRCTSSLEGIPDSHFDRVDDILDSGVPLNTESGLTMFGSSR